MDLQKLKEAYNSLIISDKDNLIPLDDDVKIMLICIVVDETFELALQFAQLFAQALENDCDIIFWDKNIKDIDIGRTDQSIFLDTLIIIFDLHDNFVFPPKIMNYLEKKSITNKIIYITKNSENIRGIDINSTIIFKNNFIESLASIVMHLSGRKPFNEN